MTSLIFYDINYLIFKREKNLNQNMLLLNWFFLN